MGAALFYGVVALLAYLVYLISEPFLAPLGWAGVIVVVLFPWHERLERRWGRTRAAAASTAGVTLILIVPALLVMSEFVRQGLVAARDTEHALASGQFTWLDHAWGWVQQHVPGESNADLATRAREAAHWFVGYLASELGAALRNVARFLFVFFVTLFAMFYLFRDGDHIVARLRDILPFEDEHRERILREARDLIFASVTSSLAAAAVHGLVIGLAFALVGVGAALFWGVTAAFCSFVPLVGSSLVWLPASIYLMATGHVGRGIVVIAICGGMAAVMDNVVRPWMISGRSSLNGLLVFISVLGGIGVFGVLGIVLGPIVVATAASLLDVYTGRERSAHAGRKPSAREQAPMLE